MGEAPSFWKLFGQNLKSGATTVFNWLVRYPVAAVIAVVVVVVGIILVTTGVDVNIGGLLKYLFGRAKGAQSVIAAGNSVPDKRVDADGNEIPAGEADERGWTQWEQQRFKVGTNPLRDREVITVTKPDGSEHTVQLPVGIKDTDVDRVIEVKPEVYVVKTHNESKHSARDVLDGLPKP